MKHKYVYHEYKKDYFGVKIIQKKFSRLPTDLTLKQTNNADATSQKKKTRISYFTNSISASQQWTDSYPVKMEHLSEVLADTTE